MKHVNDCWREIAARAPRCVRHLNRWPWRNTKKHVEAAQFSLEVERARRESEGRGRYLWSE